MILREIFNTLNDWIEAENQTARSEGLIFIDDCRFQLLGQSALMCSDIGIEIRATADLDAYTNAQYSVIKYLDNLLLPYGMKFDTLSKEIWMPEETKYTPFYSGSHVTVELAEVEYLLVSKAKFAMEKNRPLLIEYLSKEPTELFFELAEKYKLDLGL